MGIHNTTLSPMLNTKVTVPANGLVSIKGLNKKAGTGGNASKGLAIDMSCPGWPQTLYMPTVVMQYADVKPGNAAPLTGEGRPTSNYGSYCWAGTNAANVTLTINGTTQDRGSAPQNTVTLWVDPMVASEPDQTGQPWKTALDGSLGNQDLPYCQKAAG